KENRWVLNNLIDLRRVFREELENALLAYIIIESVINAIEKDGGVLVRNKYDVELIDVDEVYDGINELWNVMREH
ncbi:MAG: hypothetical protein QXS70_00170, partial [Desulfurococcaceae archaeon]